MKQVPVITMYERNVKGEEVVRITYSFYLGVAPKLDLYWVYGQHDNGQPYDYFHQGVVTYQNGNEHIWTKED